MDFIMSMLIWSSSVRRFDYLFYVKWLSTFILLTGVTLTTYNVYPMNVYVSLIGNLGWLYVALRWRDAALITIQAVIVMIYLSGMVTKALS